MRYNWRSLIALFGAIFVASCDTQSPPIMIGAQLWPGYEPLFLAANKGFLSPTDARLIQYSSSAESIRGLQNGVIQGAMVTLDEAVTLLESGVPIKVILVLDSSAGGDAVIGRPNVERFEDLAGRSVGFEFSAVNAFVLCKASQIHALDCRRDFRKVDVPLNDQEQAFLSGTVDAVVTFEPFKSRLIRQGGNLLFDTKEIPEDVVDVLVVHESAIQTNHNKIQSVVNAWFLAIDHIKANPEDSNQIMRQRAQLTAGEFKEAMAGIILGDRELNHRMMAGGDPIIYHNLPNIIRFMKDYDLIFTAPKIDGVIEPAFIGNVRQ